MLWARNGPLTKAARIAVAEFTDLPGILPLDREEMARSGCADAAERRLVLISVRHENCAGSAFTF